MFLGIVMACGLNGPMVTGGCAVATAQKLAHTEEECVEVLLQNLPAVEDSLPEGAYIASVACAKLDRDT